MTTNHHAHGPVSLERLHQISEILSKAAVQSDGGNLGYAMADAVKVIDGAIAVFGAEPVAEIREDLGRLFVKINQPSILKAGDRLYTILPAQLVNTIDETLIESLRLVQCMLDDYRERNYGHAQEWIRHISAKMEDYSEQHGDDAYSVISAAMLQSFSNTEQLIKHPSSNQDSDGKALVEEIKQPASKCPKCGGRGSYWCPQMCGPVDCECTLEPVSNSDELPEKFKPVADLYEVTVPSGRSTTFTKDAAEASDCRVMGWSVQEYVKLERYQEALVGNSPETPDGWIPVSERMPDKLIPVMVMYEDGEMWSAMWNGNSWDDGTEYPDPHEVTHWREMPSAPKREE